MTPSEFETLLTEADLHPHRANVGNGIAFSVSHHVPTEILRLGGTVVRSLRVQCDWITYETSALIQLTSGQAEGQIETLKRKLERAAKTKQGITK
jgi:hypothetical protein